MMIDVLSDALTRGLIVGVLAAMMEYELEETMPTSSTALVGAEARAEGENDRAALTGETARHPSEPYQDSMELL